MNPAVKHSEWICSVLCFCCFLQVTQMASFSYKGISPLFNSVQLKIANVSHISLVLISYEVCSLLVLFLIHIRCSQDKQSQNDFLAAREVSYDSLSQLMAEC